MYDYSEFVKARDDLKSLAKGIDGFLIGFLQKQGQKALRHTKENTPVDTGYLRENFEISAVEKKGDELCIYLVNHVEYAEYVEYGHMMKNGQYMDGVLMATLAISEVEDAMPASFKRAFNEWIKARGLNK